MTNPPTDSLYKFVLKEGATRDAESTAGLPRYSLRGNATRLFLAQRGLCFHFHCNKPMVFQPFKPRGRGHNGYSFEHIIPKSQGGGGGTNIVLAHGRCNILRGIDKLAFDELVKRDNIWAIAAKFDSMMIHRLARNLDLRGKLFDETWLNYKGGYTGTTW